MAEGGTGELDIHLLLLLRNSYVSFVKLFCISFSNTYMVEFVILNTVPCWNTETEIRVP